MPKPEHNLEDYENALGIAAYFAEKDSTYMPYFLYMEQAVEKKRTLEAERDRMREAALKFKKQSSRASGALPRENNQIHM